DWRCVRSAQGVSGGARPAAVARSVARPHPRTRGRRSRPLDRRPGEQAPPQAQRRQRLASVQDGAQRRLSARRQGRCRGRNAVNTLRVKIALLLVVAILSLLFLLTIMLFLVLGPPRPLHSL